MFDSLIQNFNWPTFMLALGTFALVSSLYNLLIAYWQRTKAKKQVAKMEKKYYELKDMLKANEAELNRLLKKKENK